MKTAFVRYSVGYCMLYIVTHIHLCGDNKETNKQSAPYSKNYVHQFLFFFVRNSFESTIKDRPVRIQMDRTGPVQLVSGVEIGGRTGPYL